MWAFASVVAVVAAGLLGLRMWLAARAKTFEHAPIATLQKRIDDLENRLLAGAMRGGR